MYNMIKRFEHSDYPLLVEWWKSHKWPSVPQECLPQIGFIVNDLCAGFLYQTDSSICIMEWIIADKKSDLVKRRESLDILIATLSNEAKNLGFKHIFTSTPHTSLISRYKKLGFNQTDTNVTNLLRSI